MRNFTTLLCILLFSILPAMAQSTDQAVAVVQTTINEAPANQRLGTLHFVERDGQLMITGKLSGLKPGSLHGFHIHQFGDLTKDDATSAGGHFSPAGNPHGSPAATLHHAGDLGNLKADAGGNVYVDMKVDWLTLNGPNGILGRSVVLHAEADDLHSQPSGDAGPRMGIGVIGLANPDS